MKTLYKHFFIAKDIRDNSQYNHLHFVWIFLLVSLFYTICAYILPIKFEENDDVVMLLFASGKYTGQPESHLVFINVIYGYVVSLLYSLTNKIEWYTLLFAIIHIVSLSTIIWIIIRKNIAIVWKILFVLFFALIEIRLILQLQFTTTAALAGLAGILLIIEQKRYLNIIGVCLLILSSLIRFEVAMMLLLISSPIFTAIFIHNNKRLSKNLIYLLVGASLIVLFKQVDYFIIQKDTNWANYQQYNKLRGEINDNPNAEKLKEQLPYNINMVDYDLFHLFFTDINTMNIEKLTTLNQAIKKVSLEDKLKNIYPSLSRYRALLLLSLLFWGVVFITNKNKTDRYLLLGAIAMFYLLLSYISLEGALKYRVFISALIAFMYVLIYFFDTSKFDWKNIMGILFFILLCFVFTIKTKKIRNYTNSIYKYFNQEQLTLLNKYLSNDKNTIVSFYGDFQIEFLNPFEVSNYYQPKQMLCLGWLSGIPYNKGRIDSYMSLVDSDCGIFFENKNIEEHIDLILKSIKINYGVDVEAKTDIHSSECRIIKLYRKNNKR